MHAWGWTKVKMQQSNNIKMKKYCRLHIASVHLRLPLHAPLLRHPSSLACSYTHTHTKHYASLPVNHPLLCCCWFMSTLAHDSKHKRLNHVPCWEVQPTCSYMRRWNSLVVRPDAYTRTRFCDVSSLSRLISLSVCVKATLQPRMTHKQRQLIVLKPSAAAGRTQVPAGPWGDAFWPNRGLEDAHKDTLDPARSSWSHLQNIRSSFSCIW